MNDQEQGFEIAAILAKMLTGEISPDEQALLNNWAKANAENQKVLQRLTNRSYLGEQLRKWNSAEDTPGWEKLQARLKPQGQVRVYTFWQQSLRYAAVIIPLLMFCTLGWYLFKKDHPLNKRSKTNAIAQIVPGSNKARLILSNGNQVELQGHISQAIKEHGGASIKVDDNKLDYAYNAGTDNINTAVFNTLITPRGGQYQVDLPDGTKVWLNAASSLRFPIRFNGAERKVYLSGEAYFEVTKDAAHPFIVSARKMDIKVLGTKFNVKAYSDEDFDKTTLTEGHVLLTATTGKQANLYPGFQSTIGYTDGHIQISQANIGEALAWKNGMFVFDSEPLESIMRKISRWYDIDVEFSDQKLKEYHFTGRIKRQDKVEDILNLITATAKVKYKLTNRTLTISPVITN